MKPFTNRHHAARALLLAAACALALPAGPLSAQTGLGPRPLYSGPLNALGNELHSLNAPLAGGYGIQHPLTSTAGTGPLYDPLSANAGWRSLTASPAAGPGGSSGAGYAPGVSPLARWIDARVTGISTALPTSAGRLAGPPLAGAAAAAMSPQSPALPTAADYATPPYTGAPVAAGWAAGEPSLWESDLSASVLPTETQAAPNPAARAAAAEVAARRKAQAAIEAAAAADRQVVRARASFAKGDYDASILRLQVALSMHPESALVRNLLVRSLIATGGFNQAAFHVKVLLARGPLAPDLADLYAPDAYPSPDTRKKQGDQLAAFAASPNAASATVLLYAYWLLATGEPTQAAKTLARITDPAYSPHLARFQESLPAAK